MTVYKLNIFEDSKKFVMLIGPAVLSRTCNVYFLYDQDMAETERDKPGILIIEAL